MNRLGESMNVYRSTFWATCPADGESIEYRLEIRSPAMIRVEDIRAELALVKHGFHEAIADWLHRRFDGAQRMTATHQGVDIETLRGGA